MNITTTRKAVPRARPLALPLRCRYRRADRASAIAYWPGRPQRDRAALVMPRSFGRVLASIWDDGDFRADLSPVGRFVYIFLFSQPDIDHAGVIPLRKPRWARKLAMKDDEVEDALGELAAARYVVIDETEGELLVRSLIRRDDIWRQPNVFKAAAASALAATSPAIKAALLAEVRRLDLSAPAMRAQRQIRDDLVTHLEPFGNPSPTPPEAHPKAPEKASAGKHRAADPDITGNSGIAAGQNPSGTLLEPLANPSAGGTGKGSSYGPVLHASPFPNPLTPSPSPRPAAAEVQRGLWPALEPGPNPEEGEEDQRPAETRDIDALAASLLKTRPDWTAAAIRRAVTDPRCSGRPWDLVWEAAHILAADEKTDQPGRLPHDGPWWAEASRRLRARQAPRPGPSRLPPKQPGAEPPADVLRQVRERCEQSPTRARNARPA